MKKIYLLGDKKLGRWSLAQDLANARYLFEKVNCKIVNNIFSADLVYSPWHRLLLSKRYFYFINFFKKINKKLKVIAVVTHILSYEEEIDKLRTMVDYWVVPNQSTYNLFKSKGLKAELIPFYVDKKKIGRKNQTKEELCEILQLDYNKIKGKFLIGSFQRDSLGLDLTKPKWQKNPDLLIKIISELPKDKVLLILSSPRRHYIVKQCEKFDIPYLFFGNRKYITDLKDDLVANNINIEKIVLLYNLIDLYIVPSKIEGGPKAILESSLTKTLIVSTEVGLAPDILHQDLVYNEANYEKIVDFIKDVIKKNIDSKKYIEYNYKEVNDALNEDKLIEKYKHIIENVFT